MVKTEHSTFSMVLKSACHGVGDQPCTHLQCSGRLPHTGSRRDEFLPEDCILLINYVFFFFCFDSPMFFRDSNPLLFFFNLKQDSPPPPPPHTHRISRLQFLFSLHSVVLSIQICLLSFSHQETNRFLRDNTKIKLFYSISSYTVLFPDPRGEGFDGDIPFSVPECSKVSHFFAQYLAEDLCISSDMLPQEAASLMADILVQQNIISSHFSFYVWTILCGFYPRSLGYLVSGFWSHSQCWLWAPFHGVGLKANQIRYW